MYLCTKIIFNKKMRMKHLFTFLAIVLIPLASYGYDNESFTVKTGNDGLEMTFSVISENQKTARTGGNYNTCIDWNYEGDVTIPSKVTNNGVTYTVTELGSFSFSSCNLKSLTLPNTIETICIYSLLCIRNIESLTIPASVSRIDEGGIAQNDNLKSISVAKGNKYFTAIDNVLFNKDKTILIQYANNLPNTSYKIPNGTKRIANDAFNACHNLTDVEIPTTVTEIGDQAFYQCFRMKNVYIPASVTSIGEGAFTGGHFYLTSIEVDPKNPAYTTIDGVLYTKDMYEVVCYPTANERISYDIHTGTIEILGNSFASASNLKSVTIPTTVERIGSCAFLGCNGLQSVDIPANVTYIANQAFDYCKNLTKVVFHSPVPPETSGYSTIFGGNENITLYVPYTGIDAYSQNQSLTKVHIDPAIDWHDNHWFFVFSCVKGIDFTQSDGITAYKIVENPNISGASSASKVISTRASNNSPVMLVPVDKAGPNDCVLLYAEPGSTYTLHSDDTAPHITGNLLQAVEKDEMISSKDGEKSNFVFNGTDFVLVEGNDNVSFGTGYLQIPTNKIPEGMTSLAIESIPNAPTGIADIKAVSSKKNIYNLKGMPVNSTNNKVFKVNGKNVIVLD